MELIPAPPVPIPRLSCEISCSVNSGGGFPGCKFLSLIPAPTTSSTVRSCSVPAALQRCQNTKNTTGNEGEDGLPGQMPQGNPGGQRAPRHPFLELQTPQFASRHKNQADRAWKRKGRRKGVSKTCVHAASLRGEASTTWLKWFGGTRRAPR